MFEREVYINRRKKLQSLMHEGIAVFVGNVNLPVNYPDNTYHWRQDSDFLYFFGLDLPGLVGIVDPILTQVRIASSAMTSVC